MLIIAINGWKGSGKDEAAKVLINDFNFTRIAYADPLKESVAEDFNLKLSDLHSQEGKEAPIRDMPVYCKDAFSRHLNSFLFKEFRTIDGLIPDGFVVDDSGRMYAKNNSMSESLWSQISSTPSFKTPLYWTKRALCILEGSAKRSVDPDFWVTKAITSARESSRELVVISDLRYKSEVSATKMALNNNTDKLVTIRINRFDKTESNDPSENDLNDATFDYVIENKSTLEDFINKIKQIATKELKEVNNEQT